MFGPVLHWQLAVCALAHASQALLYRQFIPKRSGAEFECKQAGYAVSFPFDGLLEHALDDKIPRHVELWFASKRPTPEHEYRWTSGFASTQDNFISPIFLGFMERQSEWYRTNITRQTQNWPETLNFGRVVRNATAHNGRIKFEGRKPAPVEWRGLRYGPADNGRQVIGADLTPADLIVLMKDVSDEMERVGAP